MIALGTGREGSRLLLRVPDPAAASSLEASLGLSSPVARVLAARRLSESEARSLLAGSAAAFASPPADPELASAAERLAGAASRGARLALVADDDLDGTAAAALLQPVLTSLGADVRVVFARRRCGGDGLDVSFVRHLLATTGAAGLVTLDCGAAADDALAEARRRGAWVVVVDHHPAAPRARGLATCVLPGIGEDCEPEPLSAAGLSWRVAAALLDAAAPGRRPSSGGRRQRLAMASVPAALGLLSDAVPLRGACRALVALGLERLAGEPPPGLAALSALVGLAAGRAIPPVKALTLLLPVLNAASRLGEPELALELLTTADAGRARELAGALIAANERRRTGQERIEEEVRARLRGGPRQTGLVAERGTVAQGWQRGLLGAAAFRLSGRLGRPVLLAGEECGVVRGSARSRGAVPLRELLGPVAARFGGTLGGHPSAVGLTLRAEAWEPFRAAALEALSASVESGRPAPQTVADTELGPGEADAALPRDLARLGPHGSGNPRPLFLLRGARFERGRGTAPPGLEWEGRAFPVAGPALARAPLRPRRGQLLDVVASLEADGTSGALSLRVVATREAA